MVNSGAWQEEPKALLVVILALGQKYQIVFFVVRCIRDEIDLKVAQCTLPVYTAVLPFWLTRPAEGIQCGQTQMLKRQTTLKKTFTPISSLTWYTDAFTR